jgi:murein DD-endopeptidase MepM/ murein hydrolase activator NlpD
VGRYDEERPFDYTQPIFEGARTVHMGVDLGAPAGVAVHAWADGVVRHAGRNPEPGDYGPVLVCEHVWQGRPLFVLLGHLSGASLLRSPVGRRFRRGDVLGWLGEPDENGGWPPHVHVQLAWDCPQTHDLPGVVAPAEREEARERYPDPAMILGPARAER